MTVIAVTGCGVQPNADKIKGKQSNAIPEHHVTKDQVHKLLREEGLINDESKIISSEWIDDQNQWLVITEQGKHDDGEPRFGHWFVDAQAKDWSGSFCRH